MRKPRLGLALLTAASLTVLSSRAFADGTSSTPSPRSGDSATTGWVVLGVGGAVGVTGIVLDCVGLTQSATVPGEQGTSTSNARTNFLWSGTALIVAGVVTGIVGGSFILRPHDDTNKKPSVRPIDEATNDAVSKTVLSALQVAPSVVVPILGATF